MRDSNYWKDRYQHTWSQSSSREKNIIECILNESGKKVKPIGLGVLSSKYLPGSAAQRGYEKGGPDLVIEGTDIYLEVTGPLVDSVDVSADLWLRPDKIKNAYSKYPKIETWVIHHLPKDNRLRVIQLNREFFQRFKKGYYKVIKPTIRGTIETYVSIPALDPCVKPWKVLIERLMNL